MSSIWEKAEEITNEVSQRLGIPIDAIFSGYGRIWRYYAL